MSRLGLGLRKQQGLSLVQSGGTSAFGASAFAPYPAPSGFFWDFVTSNNDRVTSRGEPVVSLVRASSHG